MRTMRMGRVAKKEEFGMNTGDRGHDIGCNKKYIVWSSFPDSGQSSKTFVIS